MADYRITDGQSLFDVALQKYGSVESIYTLIKDNLDLLVNVNNSNIANKTVVVAESNLVDVKKLLINNININTSDPQISDGYAYDFGFSMGFFS